MKYNMNITHVLMNNSELSKDQQRVASLDVWQTDVHNRSFVAFAELCGAKGIRVAG